ncbi:MAG: ParA family protein [Deltaproteobacteria bacterium]|nr:ParA family protein [Deltaproteobacteria bacterium]
MNKIIAVANQKGGVGKTTTAINVSCGLALKGKKVLLIDLDPQAHATIGLGIEPGSYQQAIHHVLVDKQDISKAILSTETRNLHIVPSHIRLDRAEQQLIPEMYRETILHRAIRDLDYDYIIIDCRPTLGPLTINALFACHFIIVPCEMGRYSLEGFSDLMETIDNVKQSEVLDKEKFVRILLTKYDGRKSVSNDWVMAQLEPYKYLLFKNKIRQNEALNQAHMAMESIFTFKKNSHGAEDYENFTEEVLSLWSQ